MAKWGKNKFNAKTTVVDGVKFPSKKEANRWCELLQLQLYGEIKELERQVVIPLEGRDGPLRTRTGRQMRMTVDFKYRDKRLGWAWVLEDSKGMPTRDYEVRKAVVQAMGLEVKET